MIKYFSRSDIQITKEHINRSSTSLCLKDMQIKTTMRHNFIFTTMTEVKMAANNNKCEWGCGEMRSFILFGLCNCEIALENSLAVFRMLNIELYDSAFSLLCVPKRSKNKFMQKLMHKFS